MEENIKSTQANLSETESKLKPLEQQLETAKQGILKLETGAFNAQGKLTLTEWEVDNKIRGVESEIQKIQQAKGKTQKVKELWEQGKFLNLSSKEAQMVVPEGTSELDLMAMSIAPQMEKHFGQYSNNWEHFPDTNWTVKNGELKQGTENWGNKVYGDWDTLAGLHSDQLSSLLAERVRRQLGRKFGSKVGNIKITVE